MSGSVMSGSVMLGSVMLGSSGIARRLVQCHEFFVDVRIGLTVQIPFTFETQLNLNGFIESLDFCCMDVGLKPQ